MISDHGPPISTPHRPPPRPRLRTRPLRLATLQPIPHHNSPRPSPRASLHSPHFPLTSCGAASGRHRLLRLGAASQKNHDPPSTSTGGQGPERPWLESEVLRLEAKAPVLIDMAFGSRRFGNVGELEGGVAAWREGFVVVLGEGGWKGGGWRRSCSSGRGAATYTCFDADVGFTCVGQRGAPVATR